MHKILKSEVYLAKTSGFSPFRILEMSQTMISSLLWLSFPTVVKKRLSGENVTYFKLDGIVSIDKHLPV
jgi:hypothetical protein